MSAAYVLERLLDALWLRYKQRVSYARQYQTLVEERGGQAQNDHIAFRTFNAPTGAQPAGVDAIARIFEALGYARKDLYLFSDKKLTAWHWEHKTDPVRPKIFISQLEVDQLSPAIAALIKQGVQGAPDLAAAEMEHLHALASGRQLELSKLDMLAASLDKFFNRPWGPPLRKTVEAVNGESQYGAWTLLHGNSVNHFTAYINEQRVRDWPDLEATAAALRQAGVPMKDEFEGEKGSKLRQTSTKAVMEECDVLEDTGVHGKISWSYAYYELAERNHVPGPDGKPVRFQGFLGAQATNLFEMTKRS